jgi:regulator of sigma E protease
MYSYISIAFLNIAIFLSVLSILVFVHEWGHFIVARIFKVRVEEFGIGMPPKAKRLFKWGDTEYTLNWIPLGGFVRMAGQDDFDAKAAVKLSQDPNSFENKGVIARASIVCAGVIMNFILAVFLFTIIFNQGGSSIVLDHPTIAGNIHIGLIIPNSLAEKSGIKKDDILVSVNGQELQGLSHIKILQPQIAGKETVFIIKRGTETLSFNLIPDSTGKIGIGLESPALYLPLTESFIFATQETWAITKLTVGGVGTLVTTLFAKQKLDESVGGPVKIFELTSLAGHAGIIPLLTLVAILSISLGVINILPFPALDGGRLIFILTEGVLRRRIVNTTIEGYIHLTGFALLIMLIIAVTWKDILSLL